MELRPGIVSMTDSSRSIMVTVMHSMFIILFDVCVLREEIELTPKFKN